MLPNVDHTRLSDLFNIRWTLRPRNDKEAMALRVITDAFLEKDQESILRNAVVWINEAYEEGYRKGLRTANERWASKINRLFEMGEQVRW